MRDRAAQLLENGTVQQVLAWQAGEIETYPQPAFFTTVQSLDSMVYNQFCSTNLSKYMIDAAHTKTLVFLRPCDTYSYNQLLAENQIKREHAYIIGIGCNGCALVKDGDDKGLLERCQVCTKTQHMVYDELLDTNDNQRNTTDAEVRFKHVHEIEALDESARFAFWSAQLQKCIRCNACRNICPVCHCNTCVFDGEAYDTLQKANASQAEGQMFHITRALHVAGRCSDCGQCSMACPQDIPLHLLNRKLIADINAMYGNYQAGQDIYAQAPLSKYDATQDPEPRRGVQDV